MAKKSTMKMLAMVLAFGIVISNLSVASFAKNDKHNEPETEAVTTNPDNDKTKFKSDEKLAFDKQDIVVVVDGKEYNFSAKGSKQWETEDDIGELGLADGQTKRVTVKANGEEYEVDLTNHCAANGNNNNNKHGTDLYKFSAVQDPVQPTTQKPETPTQKPEPPTQKPETTTQKTEATTQKTETTTQKTETTTQKTETTTQKTETTTQKTETTTQKTETTTQKTETTTEPEEDNQPPKKEKETKPKKEKETKPTEEPTVEILDDEETPLTDAVDEAPEVEEPVVEEPAIEIPDEISPLADVPVTGDMTVLYGFVCSISGLAMAAVLKKEH